MRNWPSAFVCQRILVLACGMWGSIVALWAQKPSLEYQVKSAFLYHFTQFVEWPATAFKTDDSPLIIGVLGPDPFGRYLDQSLKGEKAKEHPIVVRHYDKVEDAQEAHLLYVGYTEKGQFRAIVPSLKNKSILTVGDSPYFLNEGGMVRFFTDEQKIRFQINQQAYKREQLVLSSKMLRLADLR